MKTRGIVFEAERSLRSEPAATVLADVSRYGTDGTITTANWVRLPSGLWVLDFNSATPDYVEITPTPTQLDFTSEDLTLLVWANIDAVGARKRIIDRGLVNSDGYEFFIDSNNLIYFRTNQAAAFQESYSATPLTVAGGWYHIAFTRSGASAIPYLNGVNDANIVGAHVNPVSSSRTVKIGIADDLTSTPFEGRMSLFKIWNYALSAGQILNIFNAERSFFGV